MVFTVLIHIVLCPFSHISLSNATSFYVLVQDVSLHLRLEPYHPWKPHTAFPHLCSPDYPILNGSKGWATCQKLLESGWTAIPTNQAQKYFDVPVRSLISLASDSNFN